MDGSIIGGAGTSSGSVGSDKPLGAVRVLEDVIGSTGNSSGQIVSAGKIKSVVINGSVRGGAGFESGAIGSQAGLGPVVIGKDLIAGLGGRSGLIVAQSGDPEGGAISPTIESVVIRGSILGKPATGTPLSFNNFSGAIVAEGEISSVVVDGDVVGGDIELTGIIYGYSSVNNVTVRGHLKGGLGDSSGQISAREALNNVVIDKDIVGGDGFESGSVLSFGSLAKVTVGGSVLGGVGSQSGEIALRSINESGAGDVGTVTVKGVVTGGFGNRSGQIASTGRIAEINVGGLLGGQGLTSGSINVSGNIGTIEVDGNVEGGIGDRSGSILTFQNLGALLVKGSVIGGSGAYDNDSGLIGQIVASGEIGSIRIVGDSAGDFSGELEGGTGTASAQIRAGSIRNIFISDCIHGDAPGSASIIATQGNLGTIVIGKEIEPGPNGVSAQISAAQSIESLTVDSIQGTIEGRALITAVEGIDKLTVKDSIHYTDILAGYSLNREPVQAGSQIGSVVVGVGRGSGNWEATNLVASVVSNNKGFIFGNESDFALSSESSGTPVSRIASLVIKGKILSTGSPDVGVEHHDEVIAQGSIFSRRFGIEAEQIVSASVNGTKLQLNAGAHNDAPRPLPLSVFDQAPQDTFLFEVDVLPDSK